MTPGFLFLIIGVALISIELIIMQFSAFWFLFFGIGALVAAIVAWFFPELSWFASTALFLGASLGVAAILYPMLKKWQNQPSPIAGNSVIGQRAKVIEAITSDQLGKVSWSGTEWPAQIREGETSFAVGEMAVIQKLEGIRLIVGR